MHQKKQHLVLNDTETGLVNEGTSLSIGVNGGYSRDEEVVKDAKEKKIGTKSSQGREAR